MMTKFDYNSINTNLRDNPDLLQHLDRLQLPPKSDPEAKSEKQILPPVIPPGPGTPGKLAMSGADDDGDMCRRLLPGHGQWDPV